MAKQEGIIKLNGTIDSINFYFRKGKAVARKAGGGFNGKAIKNSATMVRVRENNSEFGDCSRVKKLFASPLQFYFFKRKDVTLHARLMQLFIAIKDCDLLSERGKRSVKEGLQTESGKQLLKSFCFTSMRCPVLKMDYAVNQHSLTITNLTTKSQEFPDGATHLELCLGIIVLNLENYTSTFYKTDVLHLPKGFSNFPFTLSLTNTVVETGIQIPVLMYGYVQHLNGVNYPLADATRFGISVITILT